MKTLIYFITLVSAFLFQFGCALPKPQKSIEAPATVAQATELEIKAGNKTTRFTREQLLDSSSLKEISIDKDPAYPGLHTTYQAVPASILFKDVAIDNRSTMLFKCLDGFSAPISTARLLNTNKGKSIAYIAIETPSEPWPKLKSNPQKTAGPFYLVWLNPKKSKISTEEWPFQLAGFEQKPSIEIQFPYATPGRTI
ncbi:MAG: hypothetical protein H7256_13270, partial [Bdellovibrio sp.]|nr:hypothetical protein [Bdellovibrio sp.]